MFTPRLHPWVPSAWSTQMGTGRGVFAWEELGKLVPQLGKVCLGNLKWHHRQNPKRHAQHSQLPECCPTNHGPMPSSHPGEAHRDWAQWGQAAEGTKLTKGLQHSSEERLGELGLLSLRRDRGGGF